MLLCIFHVLCMCVCVYSAVIHWLVFVVLLVYPQASRGGSDALGPPKPVQAPGNPVPLLSMASHTHVAAMSKSSIPLTSSAPMSTASQPRPLSQPPWQQPSHAGHQQQPPMWQHAPHPLMYGAAPPLPHGIPTHPTSAGGGTGPLPPLPPPDQHWVRIV